MSELGLIIEADNGDAFACLTVDELYPNPYKAIGNTYILRCRVNRNEFVNAIRLSFIYRDGWYHSVVKLSFANRELEILPLNTVIETKFAGLLSTDVDDKAEIHVDGTALLQALELMGSETVTFSVPDALTHPLTVVSDNMTYASMLVTSSPLSLD